MAPLYFELEASEVARGYSLTVNSQPVGSSHVVEAGKRETIGIINTLTHLDFLRTVIAEGSELGGSVDGEMYVEGKTGQFIVAQFAGNIAK